MLLSDNEKNGQTEQNILSSDVFIAKIAERAKQLSREQGDEEEFIPFSNWLQAEKEIREEYGLPAQG